MSILLPKLAMRWRAIGGDQAAREAVSAVTWRFVPLLLVPAGVAINFLPFLIDDPNAAPITGLICGAMILASVLPRNRHERALRALVLQTLQPDEIEAKELKIYAAHPQSVSDWVQKYRT